jgi:hypothetical protein
MSSSYEMNESADSQSERDKSYLLGALYNFDCVTRDKNTKSEGVTRDTGT